MTINIVDGVMRACCHGSVSRRLLTPGALPRYDIDLWSTAILVQAGHRLRVLITSSDFPRYDRHPNSGEFVYQATRFESALQRVFDDTERPSPLLLPVTRGGQTENGERS